MVRGDCGWAREANQTIPRNMLFLRVRSAGGDTARCCGRMLGGCGRAIGATESVGWLEGPDMRLSGWQRLGVILSIVSGLGMTVYMKHKQDEWILSFIRVDAKACDKVAAVEREACRKAREQQIRQTFDPSWLVNGIFSLVAVALAWILVYLLVWVVQWVRAGFTKDEKE